MEYIGYRLNQKLVECPHCLGDGEEPGAPVRLDDLIAICSVCKGNGDVTEKRAKDYRAEGAK